ncbi:hypothetical protein HETIRDRAFT_433171, partial [Heterobasidion irregulare TC 32-1]
RLLPFAELTHFAHQIFTLPVGSTALRRNEAARTDPNASRVVSLAVSYRFLTRNGRICISAQSRRSSPQYSEEIRRVYNIRLFTYVFE